MPINEEQIRKECQIIKEKGISDVAVVGIFSPLDIEGKQEERVKQIILEELPHSDVVLSRESKSLVLGIVHSIPNLHFSVGQLGYLERENATILNTSILKFARKTIRGFKSAMLSLGLSCPLFLTQNDGTIIDTVAAEKCPIKTFSSGPTNSMSGAAYLAGLDTSKGKMPNAQVIVADIGGTTTDVCALYVIHCKIFNGYELILFLQVFHQVSQDKPAHGSRSAVFEVHFQCPRFYQLVWVEVQKLKKMVTR